MTFRFARLVAVAATGAALASSVTTAHAQPAPATPYQTGQWHLSALTLSTLLQNGYKIVAAVNDPRSAAQASTLYLQRDQSAFKCIDPQSPADAKAKTPAAAPACLELVQPATAPEPK